MNQKTSKSRFVAMSKLIATIAASFLAIGISLGAASPASADPVDSLDLSSLSSPHGGWGAGVWSHTLRVSA